MPASSGPFLISRAATLTGHRDCVYALAADPAGERVFSAAGDGLVVAWDLREPEAAVGQVVAQVPDSVYALAFRAARQHLLIGHNRAGVRVVNLASKELVANTPLPPFPIFDIQVSEQLNRVYVALGNGALAELDGTTYERLRVLMVSDKDLRCLVVDEARNELIVAGSDYMVRVLALDTLAVKQSLPGSTNSVFAAARLPGETAGLVTAGRDARLRFWEPTADGYAATDAVVAHLFAINSVVVSPDGAVLASASMDKSIKLWSTKTHRLLQVIDRGRHAGHGTSVNKLVWLPGRNQLVSCSDDRTVVVWQLALRPAGA